MQRIPVSEKALIARINRKYQALDGGDFPRAVRKTKGTRAKEAWGRFYVYHHRLAPVSIDLEELARKLKVLGEHECLDEEE